MKGNENRRGKKEAERRVKKRRRSEIKLIKTAQIRRKNSWARCE